MLKKNNLFFKKLESFKKNTALILENNKFITYKELLLGTNKISKLIEKEKKLIFLLGRNDLETITAYTHSLSQNQLFVRELTRCDPNYRFSSAEEKCLG